MFHMNTLARAYDFRVQLSEVYILDGLSFKLYSLHHAQRKQHIVLNDAGVHLLDGRLVFLRGMNGSSLSATHPPPSILHDGRTAVYGSPLVPAWCPAHHFRCSTFHGVQLPARLCRRGGFFGVRFPARFC